MPLSSYLYWQRGQYYFRRRIPKLSTSRSPVLVSLGTKDPNLALTCVGMLTMEFENVLDAFTFVLDEIPEDLLHRYMKVRLTQSVQETRRQRRLEWVLGRSGLPRRKIVSLSGSHWLLSCRTALGKHFRLAKSSRNGLSTCLRTLCGATRQRPTPFRHRKR